jgi:hypothetical protein
MKTTNKLLTTAALLCAFPLTGLAQTYTSTTTTTTEYTYPSNTQTYPMVELEGGYWFTNLDGEVEVSDGLAGTMVDLEDDLNVDETEGVPQGRLKFNTGPNSNIKFSYVKLNYEGEGTLTRTVNFAGTSFTSGARVDSEFDAQYFGLDWTWYALNTDDGRFKLGPMLGVKGMVAETSINAPGLGVSESEDFSGAVPTVGAAMEYRVADPVSVFASASGLPAGNRGHFFDAEAGAKWHMTQNWDLSAGYRVINVKVDNDDDEGKLNIGGPFAALTLKF